RAFKKLGIQILTNTKVNRIEKDDNNLVVNYQSEEKQGEIHCEKALVSIGRKMVLPELGSVELATDGAGVIIDDYLKTNIPNIYAIGDVTGKAMLAHVASYQGIKAVENILGNQAKADYSIIPSCIYTSPEIASVGLTEADAKA